MDISLEQSEKTDFNPSGLPKRVRVKLIPVRMFLPCRGVTINKAGPELMPWLERFIQGFHYNIVNPINIAALI